MYVCHIEIMFSEVEIHVPPTHLTVLLMFRVSMKLKITIYVIS